MKRILWVYLYRKIVELKEELREIEVFSITKEEYLSHK